MDDGISTSFLERFGMKALRIGESKSGRIAIVTMREAFGGGDGFSVWQECSNYSRHAPGGIARTWRYIARDLDKEDAEEIFNRRTRGCAK